MIKLTRAYTVRRTKDITTHKIVVDNYKGDNEALYPKHLYVQPENIVTMSPAVTHHNDDVTGVVFDLPAVTWIATKCGYTSEDMVAVAHSPEEILAMCAAASTAAPTLRQQYAMAALTGLISSNHEISYREAAQQAWRYAVFLIKEDGK